MNHAPSAALAIAPQAKKTGYPPPFDQVVAGRSKRRLGEHFGLTHFGVNLTRLEPGAASALPHSHAREDELVYVLEGHPTLVLDGEEFALSPGDCCGFKAGTGQAHHLVNRSGAPVSYLEIGNRDAAEEVHYPHHDLAIVTNAAGQRVFAHKDGSAY